LQTKIGCDRITTAKRLYFKINTNFFIDVKENKMEKNVVAFMYDFDETLCRGYMQDRTLIPMFDLGVNEFWKEVNAFGKKNNMDNVLAYLYKILEHANKKNISLSKNSLLELGKDMEYFEGVLDWFDRINAFAATLGIKIEHYIISSGMLEIIQGTAIANKFKKIFACSYVYDENDKPIWPCIAVNYTNKTQYLFRIRKNQMDDLNNSAGVNAYVQEEQKMPYKNMFYFGDGLTDVPCMKLLKSKGGNSFCVYDPNSEHAKQTGKTLLKDGRVDYVVPADYRENSMLDKIVKSLLVRLAEENKIAQILKDSQE
jgi:hypothetical protein